MQVVWDALAALHGEHFKPLTMQVARDALACLHGEPRQHKLAKLEEKTAAADSLHTHTQQTVLDSLVIKQASFIPDSKYCFDVSVYFAVPESP